MSKGQLPRQYDLLDPVAKGDGEPVAVTEAVRPNLPEVQKELTARPVPRPARPKAKSVVACPSASKWLPPVVYLTDIEVADHFRVSRSTIWRWTKTSPNFPQPVIIGSGTTRWRVVDIEAFEECLAPNRMMGRGASSDPSSGKSTNRGKRRRRP